MPELVWLVMERDIIPGTRVIAVCDSEERADQYLRANGWKPDHKYVNWFTGGGNVKARFINGPFVVHN